MLPIIVHYVIHNIKCHIIVLLYIISYLITLYIILSSYHTSYYMSYAYKRVGHHPIQLFICIVVVVVFTLNGLLGSFNRDYGLSSR